MSCPNAPWGHLIILFVHPGGEAEVEENSLNKPLASQGSCVYYLFQAFIILLSNIYIPLFNQAKCPKMAHYLKKMQKKDRHRDWNRCCAGGDSRYSPAKYKRDTKGTFWLS